MFGRDRNEKLTFAIIAAACVLIVSLPLSGLMLAEYAKVHKGGAGGDTFIFNFAAFGDDKITDYQDNLDKLSFSLSVADSFDDFVITGNGTKSVTVNHGDDSIILTGAVAFTLTAEDFIFV